MLALVYPPAAAHAASNRGLDGAPSVLECAVAKECTAMGAHDDPLLLYKTEALGRQPDSIKFMFAVRTPGQGVVRGVLITQLLFFHSYLRDRAV